MADEREIAALFFDLAGTLVKMDETRQLPLDANGNIVIELLPGVAEKLRPIRDHLMFVFTNQAGHQARALTMAKVEAALGELDHQLGDILSGWQMCPHDDADRCECRKPKGGMLTELGARFTAWTWRARRWLAIRRSTRGGARGGRRPFHPGARLLRLGIACRIADLSGRLADPT